MNNSFAGKIIIGLIAAVGLAGVGLWLHADAPYDLILREPGLDNRPELKASGMNIKEEGLLETSTGKASDLPGFWPHFRGPDLDNICKDSFEPAPFGGEGNFPKLWSLEVGEGHAGAAIRDGRVYLVDYDREKERDAIRCLSLDNGEEIWRFSYPIKVKRNHGMSRTIPAVTEDYVVSLGPKCHVTCLNSKTGECVWALDLVRDFGATIPPWYAGQCPLIEKNRVILAPGGSALVMAVDLKTGEALWQTPNPKKWAMTHCSLLPLEFKGKSMYVFCASLGVVGVSAEDGKLLWETTDWKIRIANVPTPLEVGEGKIFFCGGYGAGSLMLQLEEVNGVILPNTLFKLKPKVFGSEQQTPILYKDHIFGVRPDEQLVCLDLQGNEVWTSSSAFKFGIGPYAIAGDILYVMNDEGLLSRVKADTTGFFLLDQTDVLDGSHSWGPMAFANGKMIVRDIKGMACIDLTTR